MDANGAKDKLLRGQMPEKNTEGWGYEVYERSTIWMNVNWKAFHDFLKNIRGRVSMLGVAEIDRRFLPARHVSEDQVLQ